MERKAISFSLYGQNPMYSVGAIENARLAAIHYPGWEVVMHVEKGHYATNRLRESGCRVIEHNLSSVHAGMKWRFETADDLSYSHVIIRDADSRISERDAACTREWLAADKALHTVRDHPNHKMAIMGCAVGLKPGCVDMGAIISSWSGRVAYGADEKMLQQEVWPRLKDNSLVHDNRKRSPGAVDLPNVGSEADHVGRKIRPHFPGFVADMIPERTRLVVLNPEAYRTRRERFHKSFEDYGGFLKNLNLEMWKATPHEECYSPREFRGMRGAKHWWAATRDHVRIMEETLAGGYDQAFIFEDDSRFTKEFCDIFWKAWCALPVGWGAMRVGWRPRGNPEPVVPGILNTCPGIGGRILGNFWSRAGLQRMYGYIWKNSHMVIDDAFGGLRRSSPHGWYQPHTKPVYEDPDSKQRGNDRQPA